jgi:hypothetical protein
MASDGVGLSDITSYLNDNKIKTPSSLKRKNPNAKNKYNPMWTISSVKKILKNQMYVGDMVQSVQTKVSYKSKKKKTLPKSNWDIVKNTHEALVDRIVFEKVQDNVKRTTRTSNTKREKRLFENLLYCKECGNTLTISYRKNHDYWTINCNRYSRDPRRRMCEPHFIPYDKLEVALLETIKKTCKQYLDAVNVSDIAGEIANKKKNDFKTQERIKELESKEKEYLNKLDMLYEDRFKGMVSDETYKRIANDTEVLLNKIRSEINKLKDSTKVIKNKTDDLKEYENKIKALIDIENPTRELMPLLEYSKWENFHKVIKRAIIACETSNNKVIDHFPEFRKPIIGGKGNVQNVIDYHLSRYACYLIVQNANSKYKAVLLGQIYLE